MSSRESAPLFRVEAGPALPDGTAEWIEARSRRRLRAAFFEPKSSPRGSVVLSPGRTEPIEKYGEVASDLLARGFAVLIHDWAGQGLSHRFQEDRLRGDVQGGPQAFLSDYGDVVAAFARRLPRPWIAMGHSMGGALTALALSELDVRFDGAVLCAPMMEFSAGKLPVPVADFIVGAVVRGGFGEKLPRAQTALSEVPFEANVLTHDRVRYQQMLSLYRAHPELCIGEPTWRWLRFGLDLRRCLASSAVAQRIAIPTLVVAAGDDRVVHNAPIRSFAARLPRGIFYELAGAFHEIMMELDEYRARFFEYFDELAAGVVAARQHRG